MGLCRRGRLEVSLERTPAEGHQQGAGSERSGLAPAENHLLPSPSLVARSESFRRTAGHPDPVRNAAPPSASAPSTRPPLRLMNPSCGANLRRTDREDHLTQGTTCLEQNKNIRTPPHAPRRAPLSPNLTRARSSSPGR